MLIGCKNPAPTRTYHVAGKSWLFTRPEANQSLRCDVDDPIAAELFLAPHNANLFFSLNAAPVALTRKTPEWRAPEPDVAPPTVAAPAERSEDAQGDAVAADIPAALALLGHSVRELREHILTVNDTGLLRSAIEIEAAKTDPRSSIITLLDSRLKALA